MERNKESAIRDSLGMISHSWTWERMTAEEKMAFKDVIFSSTADNALKGSYNHRRAIINAIYTAFLYGVGYSGSDWREPETTEQTPKF